MKKYKSGMLFGTFHPLHDGHISLIRRAYELCDKLYVMVDSNDLIRKKGREPILPVNERVANLGALKGVEFVGVESYEFPKVYWVNLLKPDVLIKGDDWVGRGWDGERLCKTIYLPHTQGIHSTDIWLGNTLKTTH